MAKLALSAVDMPTVKQRRSAQRRLPETTMATYLLHRTDGFPRLLAALLVLLVSYLAVAAPVTPPVSSLDALRRQSIIFEANRGQASAEVRFLARGRGYSLFLTASETVFTLRESAQTARTLRIRFVGANPTPTLTGEEPLPGVVNYSRHGGPGSATVSQVSTYAKVRVVDVYPGIDVVYYERDGKLEYDFLIAADADPSVIALAFEGAQRLELDREGGLVLHTARGALRQGRPLVYQERDGVRQAVAGEYVLRDSGRVALRLGAYDKRRTLVVDPTLVYSTYLGGAGAETDPLYGSVVAVAVDDAGNTYVTGTTQSIDFPTTTGADRARGGNQDAFVTKFSSTGTVLYSTYLGGACNDTARGIAVNPTNGEAYVTGRAHAGCNMSVRPGVMVAKLSATGALSYFYTFGGSLGDSSIGQAIAVNATGEAYVTGLASASSRDFPTTPGALRRIDCGVAPDASGNDGFVAKLNSAGNGLLYSTYLCGNAHDSANAIAIDSAGHAYVVGSTTSRDFPTRNAYQPTHRGVGPEDSNAFIAKFAVDGSALVYGTFLGGRGSDVGDTSALGIAVDALGQAHVTGYTVTGDFPTTPGVVQPNAGNRNCFFYICQDAFVSKFTAAGSALIYSSYLYGEGNDKGNAIKVDALGNAYIAGETASLHFPIMNAFQNAKRDLSDGFVVKLNPSATRLVYASYLGGGMRPASGSISEGLDAATSIALHAASGQVYVTGSTNAMDFPTAAASQPNLGGGLCGVDDTPCGDGFVTKIAADGPGVTPPVRLTVTPVEIAVGGSISASWSGIPAPTANDELRLYPLGAPADQWDAVASWPTNGAASGSRTLTLALTLAPGSYELRLLSPDPAHSGLLGVIARSQPLYLGTFAAGLSNIALNPSSVSGAMSSLGTVTLNAAAPAGGISVSLASSNTAAVTLPPSVSVAAGASSATFVASAKVVASATTVTISASANAITKSAALTVNPPIKHVLTLSKSGSGAGTVTSNPAGIACGSDCSEAYASGTLVNLTAVAAPGSTFTGWSGACAGSAACSVSMSAAKSVTASFAPPIVSLRVYDSSATESGPTSGALSISRTGATTSALTLSYTVSGTATAGTDYPPLSRSLTIPAGASTANLTLTPINDALAEANETIVVSLATHAAYLLSSLRTGTVTIRDNDSVVSVLASDASATEAPATTGIFTVTRSGNYAAALSVRYTLSGTASAGADYAALSGSVVIPAGASSAAITLTPIDDALRETTETVLLTLSSDPGYTLTTTKSASVVITSNE